MPTSVRYVCVCVCVRGSGDMVGRWKRLCGVKHFIMISLSLSICEYVCVCVCVCLCMAWTSASSGHVCDSFISFLVQKIEQNFTYIHTHIHEPCKITLVHSHLHNQMK